MRYPRRIDNNQREIVREFRRYGWSVAIISSLGAGIPDLIVGATLGDRKYTALIEVKDGSKPPSARKLTACEEIFRRDWLGDYHIITSVEDVANLIAAVKEG